ncbi:glycoside hydrolase family 36 protein [Microbacterium sp. ZW T5_45]|uniref:glycoside hydrolase family 36 protein n=1 Tax=Microbacterium sp. ZW T5_45 TaxID=3378080 RepID=UPI0038533456
MTLLHTPGDSATREIAWNAGGVELVFGWDAETAVRVERIRVGGVSAPTHRIPLVEPLLVDGGHTPASDRLAHTASGSRLRFSEARDNGDVLEIEQRGGGALAVTRIESRGSASSVRFTTTLTNDSPDVLVLRALPSAVIGLPLSTGVESLSGWTLTAGRSEWLGEGRWTSRPLPGAEFPGLAEELTGHNPRGSLSVASTGTWSTGRALPGGVLAHDGLGMALAWQIEHNGSWRWEIGSDTAGAYLALSGPTDTESAWTQPLALGESFTTVPVTIAFGADLAGAVAALTAHRREVRRPHIDNAASPVVFNDYMNTLDGDPTTDKLLPLIAAAAEVGAEIFCIDAGWYDDSGHWWDSVGLWQPSTSRFPGGMGEVIEAIRAHGMVPGLWLEPEVIGVRSPAADALPAEAFLQRHGARIVEHDRYHLDLRHPAAVAHLDGVVDRLIADFGIGFFKFDYNIDPGSGTDLSAVSTGAGLLEHNRAHLAWLDRLLDRHPHLVIENCGSGAMRADFAMMSRLAMQSTSDQQDFRRYPPIAASAPMSMLPEQAASWAYPQPEMDPEEASFALVTGLLGRYYVSGHLNRMTTEQRHRVATAITVAKRLREDIGGGSPYWPIGLPGWDDEWVALGLTGADADVLSVWRRGARERVELQLPHLTGKDVTIETVFPLDLPEWQTDWDAATGTLRIRTDGPETAARTLRIHHTLPDSPHRA